MKQLSAYDIIQTILVTEKCSDLNEQDQYVFKVHPHATKIDIARAVEEIYSDVKVKSVNVMNYKGKPKRIGRTIKQGRRSNWKKAVVALSQGTIDVLT